MPSNAATPVPVVPTQLRTFFDGFAALIRGWQKAKGLMRPLASQSCAPSRSGLVWLAWGSCLALIRGRAPW